MHIDNLYIYICIYKYKTHTHTHIYTYINYNYNYNLKRVSNANHTNNYVNDSRQSPSNHRFSKLSVYSSPRRSRASNSNARVTDEHE